MEENIIMERDIDLQHLDNVRGVKKKSKKSFVEQFDFFATIAEFLVLIPRAIWQILK